MKVIHLLRKPCSEGTVAANVIKHGTGALNIDATRVAHANPTDLDAHRKMVEAIKARGGSMANSWANSSDLSGANEVSAGGRWPANLVLQHLNGCKQEGTREVRAARWRDADTPHNPESPTGNFGAGSVTGRHYGKDGTETVAAWTCAEGCPVAGLDAQSGNTKAVTRKPTGKPIYATEGSAMVWNSNSVMDTTERGFTDEGGASRYFKQLSGTVSGEE
jgi:hypothetical protein